MTVLDVKLGLKKLTTIPCSILEKILIAMREVNLGLGISLIPPIVQVILVDNLVFIVMVTT